MCWCAVKKLLTHSLTHKTSIENLCDISNLVSYNVIGDSWHLTSNLLTRFDHNSHGKLKPKLDINNKENTRRIVDNFICFT